MAIRITNCRVDAQGVWIHEQEEISVVYVSYNPWLFGVTGHSHMTCMSCAGNGTQVPSTSPGYCDVLCRRGQGYTRR